LQNEAHALTVLLYSGWFQGVEGDNSLLNYFPKGQFSGELMQSFPKEIQVVVELTPGDVVLGGEVPKESAPTDPYGGGNLVGCRAVEST